MKALPNNQSLLAIALVYSIIIGCNPNNGNSNANKAALSDSLHTKKVESKTKSANAPKYVDKSYDTVFIKHDSSQYSKKLKYVTDTVIFNKESRQILIGTTIIPETHSSHDAWVEYGFCLNKVVRTKCKKEVGEEPTGPDQINSIISSDSTLVVDINITDNCCYSFLCDVGVDNSATLNLIYTGYGMYCDCDCCFGLTYYFKILKSPDYFPKKIRYKPVKAVMINGNAKSKRMIKK
ncbi:MAG TPA: hypothetical protein VK783_16380 [Bacteroidia bacterium]|nr:hypothetical protein [Bacteroidia bacterium]